MSVLAIGIVGLFLFTLVQEVGQYGRTWIGWIETTQVTTTDFQPLVSPKEIFYPADFPAAFRLNNLPAGIKLNRIASLAVYRLDSNIVAYSIRGNVDKRDDTADTLKEAMEEPGFTMEFWMGNDKDNFGDFWIKWNVET